MAIQIRKASRQKAWLKVAMTGITGAGKTYSALLLAKGMAKRPLMIDTENGSGELYSHLFEYDYIRIAPPFTPAKYVEAIEAAVANGNDFIIVDSLSHAWKYVLDYKDGLDAANPKAGFANWRKAKKLFDETMTALLQSPVHICACMREKSEYTETVDSRGTKHMTKTGTNPIAEPDLEFEFTVCWKIERSHQAVATKDRTEIWDVATPFTISPRTGEQLLAWSNGGVGALISRPDWKSGMLTDDETTSILDEAAKVNDKSGVQPIENHRDILTLWGITPEEWSDFRELVKPSGRKPSDVLIDGYKRKFVDLNKIGLWVMAGFPDEPATPHVDDQFGDDAPNMAPVAQITATASAIVTKADGTVEDGPDPAVEQTSTEQPAQTDQPEAVQTGTKTIEQSTSAPDPHIRDTINLQLFGYTIQTIPLDRQFENPASDGQIKLLAAKAKRANINDDLLPKLIDTIAKAVGVPVGNSGIAAIIVEFLGEASSDSIDLAIAEAENPQGTLV